VQSQVNNQWICDFIVLHDKLLIYGSSGVEQSGLCLITFPKTYIASSFLAWLIVYSMTW
jgi:hypothetical protein